MENRKPISEWTLKEVQLYSEDGFVGVVDENTGLWDGDYYGMTGDGKHGLHLLGWISYRRPPEKET